MKIVRYKKAQRTLNFYKNNYDFREPYQVLIDGTFCNTALQFQIKIHEQLSKYFQSDIKIVTTQCIILEAESLGTKCQGATLIVKQFYVHKCGHEKNPKLAAKCIKSMIKDSHYIVATQDRELQNFLRLRPGQPLLYLHNRTPVLEQPSESSRIFTGDKMKELIVGLDTRKLKSLKIREGVPEPAEPKKRNKFKKKQPNPLSCKKKKRKSSDGTTSNDPLRGISCGGVNKKSRVKIKIAKHIREHLKSVKK